MSDGGKDVIHVFKKVSDANLRSAVSALQASEGLSAPIDADSVAINVTQRKSSSNLLRKASDSRILGAADLNYSEIIGKQKSGAELNDEDAKKVDDDGHGDSEFVFNHTGLTSAQVKAAFEKHGPNKLPEKSVSKLFLFCQQLWQVSLFSTKSTTSVFATNNFPLSLYHTRSPCLS